MDRSLFLQTSWVRTLPQVEISPVYFPFFLMIFVARACKSIVAIFYIWNKGGDKRDTPHWAILW
jgi:hypothetical protein